MEAIKHPLSNTQLEILKTFSHNLGEQELRELRNVLAKFFAEIAIREANRTWDEKGWTNETVQQMLETKMRTPYSQK